MFGVCCLLLWLPYIILSRTGEILSVQLWRIKAYSWLPPVDVSTPLVTLFGVTAPHIFHSILISHVLTRRVSFMSLNCYVGLREVVTFFCRIILLHRSHLRGKISHYVSFISSFRQLYSQKIEVIFLYTGCFRMM